MYCSICRWPKGLENGWVQWRDRGHGYDTRRGARIRTESNWTYEVGAKTLLLDKRLVLNAVPVDWSDMQTGAAVQYPTRRS